MVNLIPLPTRTITDTEVSAALRRVVQIVDPVLYLLWESDPLGLKNRSRGLDEVDDVPDALAWLLNAADLPGTAAWDAMDVDERVNWWVRRVGAVNTVAVAFPGFLGVLADRLPIQDLLGFTNQTLVLLAVARERGITDLDQKVQLLGAVLCDRTLNAEQAVPVHHPEPADGAAGLVWTTVGLVRAIGDELTKRPHPRLLFRYLGMLPAVGAIADFIGEFGALNRAADEGQRWIAKL